MLAGTLDGCRYVVGKEVTLLYERGRRILHQLQILLARVITLFHGETRIARLLAFGFGAREGM